MKEIKTFIAEHLINTTIFEMAKSLSDFKDLVENMIEPILLHILLILKAREEKSDEYINHWKRELRTFFYKFTSLKLKVKSDFSHKRKYVYNKLINELELDTNDLYILRFYSKLYSEGYDLDDDNIKNDFIKLFNKIQNEYLDKIIDIMASGQENEIFNFVNSL